jgi:elongation factor P
MGVIDAGQLKKGLAVLIDNVPHLIAELDFVKPGKGQALYKCKLRNLRTDQLYDRTYRSGERFETADVTESDLQFLYADGDFLHFMHTQTFEQLDLRRDAAGDALNFLKESMVVKGLVYNGHPISIDLPNFVNLLVAEAEPGVKGDTAAGASKPVTMETGLVVQVPLFINQGETLRIDTRTGAYVERVKR